MACPSKYSGITLLQLQIIKIPGEVLMVDQQSIPQQVTTTFEEGTGLPSYK